MTDALREILTTHVVVCETGCWEWTGRRLPKGYGRFRFGGRVFYAHRLAYELFVGAIPTGLFVLHTCDNPPCVNPAHLWLGTAADNNADRVRKGRSSHAMGRPQTGRDRYPGSPLTAGDVAAIRRLLADGRSGNSIAKQYRVSDTTIRRIREGRRWAHVAAA